MRTGLKFPFPFRETFLKIGLISTSLSESGSRDVLTESFKFTVIKPGNMLLISNDKNVIFWVAFEEHSFNPLMRNVPKWSDTL